MPSDLLLETRNDAIRKCLFLGLQKASSPLPHSDVSSKLQAAGPSLLRCEPVQPQSCWGHSKGWRVERKDGVKE